MELNLNVDVPDKLLPIFDSKHRYIVLEGGRGGGKSHIIARALIIKGIKLKRLILCTREIQKTIADSVHRILKDLINEFSLNFFYTIQKDKIIGNNGTEFIFKGLKNDPYGIKSTEGITDCWIEEAHSISEDSWDILIPTVRVEESQFYISFNPDQADDPVYKRFILAEQEGLINDQVLHININYNDNPFFPEVLKKEMEWCRKTDFDKFQWIWEGQLRKISEAQIFKGKYAVEDFESPNMQLETFYFGADWGFANDPTCLVRSFIKDNRLYIDYEAWGIGVEFEEIPQLFDSVPGSRKFKIVADCARPETISYIKNKGFYIVPSNKWQGSVEDGISFLRSFEKIVINPRCRHTIEEFKMYSYKKDAKTNEILPVIVDKMNHGLDGLRYSLQDFVKKKTNILDRF
jgi:phage terminase large subunit